MASSIPSGLHIQEDPQNAYNKIIYSKLNTFESRRASQGLSLKYVYSGDESYFLSGRRYRVRSGEFLLVNHQQEVETAVYSEKPVEGICLYFDPEMISRLARSQRESNETLLDAPYYNEPITEIAERVLPLSHSRIMPYLTRYYQSMPSPFPVDNSLFYAMLESIFSFEYDVRKAQSRISAARKSTRRELYSRMLLAQSFLLDNLSNKVLIRDLSRIAMMSEFHFLRTFREAFGITPNQFIIIKRLEKARSLLRNSRLTITSIAIDCGFNDVQYFSRSYKKYYGRTPSAERQ
jgi:AraC-like DNA-binding protein